jgi:hypothetical protein
MAVALGILVWVASAGYAMSLRILIVDDIFFARTSPQSQRRAVNTVVLLAP